jgi:hypothetical protein
MPYEDEEDDEEEVEAIQCGVCKAVIPWPFDYPPEKCLQCGEVFADGEK